MNILIVGDNKLNSCVKDYFDQNGFTTDVVEDIYKMRSLSGEAGGFQADMRDKTLEAGYVVLTEQPQPDDFAGTNFKSIYDDNKLSNLSKTDRLSPIVFLLDYMCESSMAATIRALSDAKDLAQQKRRVYYLAKFIRTAGHEIESLYRDARKAGVTFVKYENLQIDHDNLSDIFTINVSDGVEEINVETKSIYADGGRGVGERFSFATKKLHLWPDEKGYVLEDRFFLTPVKTSRRGVFHLSRDLAAERLTEGLDYILSYIKSDDKEPCTYGTAVVDGEKCVLCYTCYRACPHAAMIPDTEARAMRNLEAACEGCGICASVCPGNAITLEKENPSSMPVDKSARTLVLSCENSANIAMEKALSTMGDLASLVDVRPVPCGGRIGMEDLTEALNSYGKVMVAVCMDDACKHFDGNKRACRHTERLVNMLESSGITTDRVLYTQASHAMPGVLRDVLIGFMAL